MDSQYLRFIVCHIIPFFLFFACSATRDVEELFTQCLTHYEKHELEKASACFEKARAHGDFKVRAVLMLARVRYFENKFGEARTLLKGLIAEEPSHTGARYWLARAFAVDPASEGADEREKSAIAHLKKVLEVDPHHVRARTLLALLYEKRNMHREALFEYLAALQEEETLVTARANLSILYRSLGLNERARTELDRAIAISKAADIPAKNLAAIKEELAEK